MRGGKSYPIGPFREWLLQEIERHARLYDMKQDDYAAMIGVHDRHLFRWLNECESVSLGSVDHVLTRGYGGPDPDLLDRFCPPGQEFKRKTPAPVKCEHGDQERHPDTGRCLICRREAQRAYAGRVRERRAAAA